MSSTAKCPDGQVAGGLGDERGPCRCRALAGAGRSGPRDDSGSAPHSPYSCHPTLFKAVAEAAGERDSAGCDPSRRLSRRVRTSSSTARLLSVRTTGHNPAGATSCGYDSVSPVQYVYQWGILEVPNVLAVHCVHVDPADIDTLARHDVAIAYCARCNLKLGMGIAPLQAFLGHEIRVGVGTDSPASNSTVDVFDEMRIGLLVQRGLAGESHFYTSERFVRLATLEGARALKIDHLVGSLEPAAAVFIAVDRSRSHQVRRRILQRDRPHVQPGRRVDDHVDGNCCMSLASTSHSLRRIVGTRSYPSQAQERSHLMIELGTVVAVRGTRWMSRWAALRRAVVAGMQRGDSGEMQLRVVLDVQVRHPAIRSKC